MIVPQHLLTQEQLQDALDQIVARARELDLTLTMDKPKAASPVVVYTEDGVIPFSEWMERC